MPWPLYLHRVWCWASTGGWHIQLIHLDCSLVVDPPLLSLSMFQLITRVSYLITRVSYRVGHSFMCVCVTISCSIIIIFLCFLSGPATRDSRLMCRAEGSFICCTCRLSSSCQYIVVSLKSGNIVEKTAGALSSAYCSQSLPPGNYSVFVICGSSKQGAILSDTILIPSPSGFTKTGIAAIVVPVIVLLIAAAAAAAAIIRYMKSNKKKGGHYFVLLFSR